MIIDGNETHIKKDCHHNSDGKVDYSPLYGTTSKLEPIPLNEQKYDFEYEIKRELAATNLATTQSIKRDYNEFKMFMENIIEESEDS